MIQVFFISILMILAYIVIGECFHEMKRVFLLNWPMKHSRSTLCETHRQEIQPPSRGWLLVTFLNWEHLIEMRWRSVNIRAQIFAELGSIHSFCCVCWMDALILYSWSLLGSIYVRAMTYRGLINKFCFTKVINHLLNLKHACNLCFGCWITI